MRKLDEDRYFPLAMRLELGQNLARRALKRRCSFRNGAGSAGLDELAELRRGRESCDRGLIAGGLRLGLDRIARKPVRGFTSKPPR